MNYLIQENSFLGIYILPLFGGVIEEMRLHIQRRSIEEIFEIFELFIQHCHLMMRVLYCPLLTCLSHKNFLSGATKIKPKELYIFSPCDISNMEVTLLLNIYY